MPGLAQHPQEVPVKTTRAFMALLLPNVLVLTALQWHWSHSGMKTAIMFIVMSLFMALLSIAAQIFIAFKVDADHIESIGRGFNRVTGLFTRKAAV